MDVFNVHILSWVAGVGAHETRLISYSSLDVVRGLSRCSLLEG